MKLTVKRLCREAQQFAEVESIYPEPSLFGVTDGKAVGTYLEQKFHAHLREKYDYAAGSSAKGIDFPKLKIDVKVTSFRQPQSSCPFRSARQKIYGLGYNLLVFVYDKVDDPTNRTATLNIVRTIFVTADRTADFQTTSGLLQLISNDANKDDVLAFFAERLLPVDEIEANKLADEVLQNPPELGFLTISNALQWRLQFGRVIEKAGSVEGIIRVR